MNESNRSTMDRSPAAPEVVVVTGATAGVGRATVREFARRGAVTTIFSRFVDIDPADYRRATEVTYLGTVHGTLAALKQMQKRDRGTIVQVGSALSYRAIPLQSPYCGAKFAIRGFTDSIRCELLDADSRIHITMVQLPAVNTPQFSWCKTQLSNHPQPVPPIFQPEVAARAIFWAAHHHRREVDVGLSSSAII